MAVFQVLSVDGSLISSYSKLGSSHLGAWSGIVYPFAGLAIQTGVQDVGMQILTAVRACYDGTRRR